MRKMNAIPSIRFVKIAFFSVTALFLYFTLTMSNFTFELKREFEDHKYVQLYTGVFDWKDWDQTGLGTIPFRNCPEKRCYAFKPYKLSQTAVEDADGVMVHGPNLWYLPSRKTYKRNPKQIWMYYALESPRGSMCSSHYSADDLDDWFNLTATYKQDSDFVMNYSPVDKVHEMPTDDQYLIEYEKNIVKTSLGQQIFKR
jgi:hypothetical protein